MDALKNHPAFSAPAFLSLLAAWTALSLLSGCRLGNRTVAPEDPDKITGYYETAATALEFCATVSGSTTCKDASPTLVPSFLSTELTNPTILAILDLPSGYAAIVSPRDPKQSQLPIYVEGQKLSFTGGTGAVTLWNDPACTSATYYEASGALVAAPPQPVAGSMRQTLGRIQLSAQIIETYDGKCVATLTQLGKCYNDASQCGYAKEADNLSLQREVQAMFGPYIQAGVLAPADLPNLSSVSYVARYE